MHQTRGNDRALLACVSADRMTLFEIQERGQRAARFDTALRYQLRDLKDLNRWKTGIFRIRRINPGKCRVGGSEIDAEGRALHPLVAMRAEGLCASASCPQDSAETGPKGNS